jgi:hypothetical protein
MLSDLYGAYSIVGGVGSDSGTIHVWCRLGGKHPVTMYRLLIPNYDLLSGEGLMFAEDWVDFLFGRNEIGRLLEYLTRHDSFGDTHTFARAEDLSLQRLRQHARKHDVGGHELHAHDDWHNPFQVFSLEVTGASQLIAPN